MEPQIAAFLGQFQEIFGQTEALIVGLTRPRQLWQFGGVLALALLAHLLSLWLGPQLREWLRTREGWPRWRLRLAVLLHQRLRLILFVGLIHLTVQVVRAVYVWPSSRYVLTLVASVATAWLVVALVTRLIRNPILRRAVAWGAWIWVTLYYLDLLDTAARLLDRAALELGEVRLSLLTVLTAVVAAGLLLTLARFASEVTSARVRRSEDLSPSMRVLVTKILQMAFYGAAILVALTSVGIDLTGFAVLSGAIGVGLGFGLQKVVSNLVSGVIILLDKSIKPGDVISLGETFGWINALGARYISITTRDGREYLIPNEDLITTQVVNWSHSNDFVRLDVHFGTAYQDDPHAIRRIAVAAAKAVDRVLTTPPPVCHITGFGDSSVDYVLRFWIADPTQGLTNIRGNVYLALWDAFKEAGVSIPFPQREVRMLGDAYADPDADGVAGRPADPQPATTRPSDQ